MGSLSKHTTKLELHSKHSSEVLPLYGMFDLHPMGKFPHAFKSISLIQPNLLFEDSPVYGIDGTFFLPDPFCTPIGHQPEVFGKNKVGHGLSDQRKHGQPGSYYHE